MKGQGKWKNAKRKKDSGKLQKYRLSVDDFVQSNGGCDAVEDDRGLRFVKKKSRKELRKEKRHLKKAKMKCHYEGKKNLDLPHDAGENSGIPADKPQQQRKKVKDEAKKEKTKQIKAAPEKSENPKTQSASKKGKKTTKLQETRKMALLEANEAEDREIKKLERCLGLNKRKNKKTLPQSFADDGLDYILGVLDSGSSAVGVYDNDDDMDTAKENLERLERSDSQMSGEEEETGDEFANESGDEDLGSADEENEVDEDDEGEDDDEMVDDEEEGMEEEEEELDESDAADSGDESEGGAESQTEAATSKSETVSL